MARSCTNFSRSGSNLRLRVRFWALIICAGIPITVQAAASQILDAEAEHAHAVEAARAGDLSGAIDILQRLHRADPNDLGVARDLIVVSGWAGDRDSDVIRLFEALPGGSAAQPAYVLAGVARAYRNERRFVEAIELYRLGRTRDPSDPSLIAGEIRSLVDGMRLDEAAGVASRSVAGRRGKALSEILLARAYLEEARGEPVEALHDYQRALTEQPGDPEALRGRVFALERLGAPELARRLAEAAPKLFSDAERRRLDAGAAAELVRFGALPTAKDAERFAATDRAIEALDGLIARWRAAGPDAGDDLVRARLDRLVALRDRVRMTEVVDEYRRLVDEGVNVPPYALEAAADAYLYLHEPERARDLYGSVLAPSPESVEARLGLYYALVESEGIDAAVTEIDALQSSLPPWVELKGLASPLPNDARVRADIAAANARMRADDLPEAQRRFEAMAALAPENTAIRGGLAGVYDARGWPRRAGEAIEIGLQQKADDLALQAASAENRLALSEWRAAEREIGALDRRAPENLEVRRLARDWQLHNMSELSLGLDYAFRSDTDVRGGGGYAATATFFSPPVAYDWRLFASSVLAQQSLLEGDITLRRYATGIEYRRRDLTITGEAGYNAWDGTARGGARAAVSWTLDDAWTLGVSGELFSRDTPLRALKNGVTADAFGVSARWRQSESREARLGLDVMDFSDGNLRVGGTARYAQRLATAPHFRVDAVAAVAASGNEKSGVPYYAPNRDLLATLGIEAGQIIYRRYERVWEHRLTLAPGGYWQQGFGASPALGLRYEHGLQIDDATEIGAGIGFGSQSFDGEHENAVNLFARLRMRF